MVLAAAALLLVLACRGYDWGALGRYKGDNISSLHYACAAAWWKCCGMITLSDQLNPAPSMGTQELRILLLEGANKGTEVTIANYVTSTSQNVRLRQGETAIYPSDAARQRGCLLYRIQLRPRPGAGADPGGVCRRGGGHRRLERRAHPAGPELYRGNDCLAGLPGIYQRAAVPAAYGGGAGCVHPGQPAAVDRPPRSMGGHAFNFGGRGAGGRCVFYLFSTLLHLSGMNDTNGEGLVLVAGQTGLELHWLLLVAVLISSLGAVMDVALSLASSLHELREADGKMSGLQLFAAGMRIGRDMIGTMSDLTDLSFCR